MELVRKAVRRASFVLLAALVVTPLAQITMRGVFNVQLAGSEELAKYFLICLTFLAASYVSAEGGQIRMEEFQVWLPPRPRWLLQLAIEASGVAVFGILFVEEGIRIIELGGKRLVAKFLDDDHRGFLVEMLVDGHHNPHLH